MSGSIGSNAMPGNGLVSLPSQSHMNQALTDASFMHDSGLGGSFVSSTSSSSRGSYGGSSLSDRASVSSSSQSGGSGGIGNLGIPHLPVSATSTGYNPGFYYSEGGAYRGPNSPGSVNHVASLVSKPTFGISNNIGEASIPGLGIPVPSSPHHAAHNNAGNSRMYDASVPMSNNMCGRDVCPDLLLRSPSVDHMRRDFPHSRSGSIDANRNDYPHHRSGSIDTSRNDMQHLRCGSIDTTRNDLQHLRSGSIDTTRNDLQHLRGGSIETTRNDLHHARSGSIDATRNDFLHNRNGSIDATRNSVPHLRGGSNMDPNNMRGEYPHPRSGSIDSTYRSNYHLRTDSADAMGRPTDFRRSGSIDAPAGRNDHLCRRTSDSVISEDQPRSYGVVASAEGGGDTSDEVLRESFMVKRSQNRSRFGPTNWRERWFVLTAAHIIYYDGDRQSGRKKEKGRVDLSSVECVERVDESVFDRDNVFQVGHVIDGAESCTLYVEAATCPVEAGAKARPQLGGGKKVVDLNPVVDSVEGFDEDQRSEDVPVSGSFSGSDRK
ncbi:uncharacterized protein LOC108678186 [Hyalella azteca]|uniref:Uncharacterized protein LOC108678186 n=1 Tax=Hyalella azteca TaxID=294128 RepID=A0A8B7P7U9_HYAAZ|nr:uncharacterized protein LOC108678186 [Hyalella azteca]